MDQTPKAIESIKKGEEKSRVMILQVTTWLVYSLVIDSGLKSGFHCTVGGQARPALALLAMATCTYIVNKTWAWRSASPGLPNNCRVHAFFTQQANRLGEGEWLARVTQQ